LRQGDKVQLAGAQSFNAFPGMAALEWLELDDTSISGATILVYCL
jgi:hypothetical protein